MSIQAKYVTVEEIEIDRLDWVEARVIEGGILIRFHASGGLPGNEIQLVFRRSDPKGEARLQAIIKAIEAVNEAEFA